ncbi:NitT/TauT family transport system ATP-binding protein [Pseudoxanthobacter soli DSM 19599]|uniref:NitT/TauT family transport system ATP-binding protein n=1 Tax=Pseudoxanthobacter soli DSM 19599 TaxID=1123029 RepID=A0A1M7ZFH7_9HYPH|nr:nitrate/sulfonate/bicarbonate ABC transporter ATP-binding protein [Pseudoxanthobacter soli]SHO63628.1 NitT/TauT family transport system ATP-binding protein [Pseudoxanthobacter soli DSM 19599]
MLDKPGKLPSSGLLVDIEGVRQAFRKGEKGEHVVLDNVALKIAKGEIVGLLGRSGSGKSTLLRIVSGLVPPTTGKVEWCGEPVTGPCEGLSMVFQSFALFPWLTVLENVEIGLEAQGIPAAERRKRALEAIDLIGLDGFESAYPKELSGGMRQRVGFARALVIHPKLMLMDEPFSALDVLTAETLRTDIIELWGEGKLPIGSILMVTHNIEEAVLMCDRILIFSVNPGRVAAEIKVDFPHPRDRLDPAFRQMVDDIYARMTNRAGEEEARRLSGAHHEAHHASIATPLPPVSTNMLAGLLEEIAAAPYNGHADLPHLADDLQLEADELFPMIEVLQMLGLADMADGDVKITDSGRHFVESDNDGRKRLFRERLATRVPLAALIKKVLDERPSHRAPSSRFLHELDDHMSETYSERSLKAAVAWGRYAELYAYDDETEEFSLDDPG